MDNYERLIDSVVSDPSLQNIGLRREAVEKILSLYNKSVVDFLVGEGFVEVEDVFRLDIVKTQPRVHVLRGKEYKSTRVYKLKATMSDDVYERVVESLDLL